ncbi:MAG: ExbD/TolR family protein [Holosporales bacterium]|jgi:biopolymer transport protein TolR|nr:ExbD/TolR family protein [Holosporales bacterium]
MSARKQRRKQPSVCINVAPLVEVMLVLIIIFMITAPMLNVGVPVDLPKTEAASLNESKTPPIIVTIDKDSEIYVEEANITLQELIQKLPLILANGKSDTIYVRGDKDLPYGRIMEIMGIISSSGACKVSLISEAHAAQNSKIEQSSKKRRK